RSSRIWCSHIAHAFLLFSNYTSSKHTRAIIFRAFCETELLHPKRKSESTKNHKNEKAEIMEENDFQIDSLTALENLVQEVGKDQNHPWHKIEEVFEDLIDSY
ncbi:unnamed protein product, partial [Oikopleura dioica]